MQKLFIIFIILTVSLLSCDLGTLYEYKITGTVASAQISYRNEHGMITSPSESFIPRSIVFHSKQKQRLFITAKNLSNNGEITVSIYIDGVLVDGDTSNEPYGTVNASHNH